MNQAVEQLIETLKRRSLCGEASHSYLLGYLQGTLSTVCNKFPEVETFIEEHIQFLEDK